MDSSPSHYAQPSTRQSAFDPYSPPAAGEDSAQMQWLRQWNEWVSQPIKPYLVVRMMYGFYVKFDLPDGVETADQIRNHASCIAKRFNRKLCLVMSRRISMWYEEDSTCEKITEAQPGIPNIPTMRFSGSDKDVTFHQKSGGMTIIDVDHLQRSSEVFENTTSGCGDQQGVA